MPAFYLVPTEILGGDWQERVGGQRMWRDRRVIGPRKAVTQASSKKKVEG
jgi:hypothetical protein